MVYIASHVVEWNRTVHISGVTQTDKRPLGRRRCFKSYHRKRRVGVRKSPKQFTTHMFHFLRWGKLSDIKFKARKRFPINQSGFISLGWAISYDSYEGICSGILCNYFVLTGINFVQGRFWKEKCWPAWLSFWRLIFTWEICNLSQNQNMKFFKFSI